MRKVCFLEKQYIHFLTVIILEDLLTFNWRVHSLDIVQCNAKGRVWCGKINHGAVQ